MAFSRGKHSKAISDRSGMEFPYLEMVKEWNGSLVHTSEFEPKQPQLEPKPKGADNQGLLNARPARTEFPTSTILGVNPISTNGTTTITVFEPDHGRSTNDIISFNNVQSVGGVDAKTFNLETTINGAITASSTQITLTDATGFPGTGFVYLEKVEKLQNADTDPLKFQESSLRIVGEVIKYTTKIGNVISNLTRATSAQFFGKTSASTTALAFDSGTKIFGGHTITVINENRQNFANATETFSNKYTFTIPSAASTTSKGGGSQIFVGPVSSRS